MAIKKEIELEVNVESVGTLKQQLKQAQREVEALSEKFGATSEQATNAARKAAQLKDAIGDAKALTDAFNPDAKFNALGGALQGVAGGFSAVQGAMGLVGVESKDVEATLLKVQSAMAVSEGINSVMAAKDAFTNLAAVIGRTAIGQKLLTAAQIAGAAAMRVLNVVMAANPILLIVSGVTALVGAFYMLVNSQKEAQITASDLNDELERQQDIISKTSKDIEIYSKLDIAYARERGASEEELTRIKEEAAKKQVKLLYQNFIETQKTYDKIKDLRKKDLATVEEVNAASKKEQEAYNKWQDAVKAKMVADAEADADKAEALRQKQEKAQEEAKKKKEDRKKQEEEDRLKKQEQDLEDAKNEEAFLQSAKDRNIAFNEDIKEKEDDVVQAKKKAWSDYLEFVKNNNTQEVEEESKKQKALRLLRENGVQGVQDTLSIISNLTELFAGKSRKQQERAFKIQKAVNIASAIMDTYKGATAALGTAPFTPYNFLAAAAVVTAGMLNVKKIASQKFDGGSSPSASGGGGSFSSSIGGSTEKTGNVIAPNFNIVGAGGANQLGSLAPIQAYVVSSEMTSQQALDRNRMRNATF